MGFTFAHAANPVMVHMANKSDFYIRHFILGEYYIFRNKKYKFIKVTRKGFNLLDVNTNKCLMTTHLYSSLWYNKEMPTEIKEVKNVRVPSWAYFKTFEYNDNEMENIK